jgi:hypothetical protein
MGAASIDAGVGEVAGRGEFVAEVVEGIGFAVSGGGEGGAGGGDQIVIAAASGCQEGAEAIDLVAEGRDCGECSAEGPAGGSPQPGAGEGVRPDECGRFGVAVSCLLGVGGVVCAWVCQLNLLGSRADRPR